MLRWSSFLVWMWVGLLAVPGLAQFGALEPGKRIKGHDKLDCQKCHTEGSGISSTKCVSCHEHRPLGSRIKAGKGLHASRDFKSKSCEICHKEHKGRSYNPIDWSPVGGLRRFDHGRTGYELEGAHRRVKCAECHTSNYKRSGRTKYLGLDADCLTCHEDVHRFRRSHKELLDCKICHSFDARTVVKAKGLNFDHGKIAEFPLRGRHNETKCSNCHSSTKSFKIAERPDRCVDCHKDIHKNVYTVKQRDCKSCHSDKQREFTSKIPKWNHGKSTDFTLLGKHKKIECVACHEKTSKTPPNQACLACHKKDSAHIVAGKDRFKGRDCAQCHSSSSFKKRVPFNHARYANFRLGGKHGDLACNDCHRVKASAKTAQKPEDTFEFFSTSSCIGCHAHKKEHDGKFNDRPKICVKCHVPGSTNIKTPDHSELSPIFAQQGAHKPVACDKCHGDGLENLNPGKDCAACHKEDDHHAGNLGNTCKNCHLEGYPWSEVIFQHNQHAEFKLKGKHQAVACNRCHTAAPKTYKPTTQQCVDCHGSQDVHQKALGTDCAKCHDETGKTVRFDHNAMTDYVLDGAHARADCTGCHYRGDPAAAVIDYKFGTPGVLCRDCHGDPHGLRPGAACEGCHDTEDFMNAQGRVGAGDDDGKGASKKVPNPDGGPTEKAMFKGAQHSPEQSGGFLEWFTGQRRVPDPYHDTPPFNLRDGHARIDCARCHGGRGDLQGLGKMCDTCHRSDDIHAGSLGPMCGNCHRQRAFTPAFFSHTQVGFSLVGAHRLLACKQCHSAGNYMGIAGDCVACHLDDAFRAAGTSGTNHLQAGYVSQACTNCHSQTSWTVNPLFRRRF